MVKYFLPFFCALFGVCSAMADVDGSGQIESPSPTERRDWESRLNEANPKPEQKIYLLMHSAKDCSFCTRWKGTLGGKGEFEKWATDHPLVKLEIIERDFITGSETQDMYPKSLMKFYEKRSEKGKLRTGVPSFEIAVGNKIVYRSYGYSSWNRSIFPALQLLGPVHSI